LAFTNVATDIPAVRNSRAVCSALAVGTAATTEVDVLHGVNTCPGVALGDAIRNIADSLLGGAGHGLGTPVAGCEFIGCLSISALVMVVEAAGRSRLAWPRRFVAALVVVAPRVVTIAGWRPASVLWLLGHAALVTAVPFPTVRAGFASGRAWWVALTAVVEAAITSTRAGVLPLVRRALLVCGHGESGEDSRNDGD